MFSKKNFLGFSASQKLSVLKRRSLRCVYGSVRYHFKEAFFSTRSKCTDYRLVLK